MGVKLFDRMLVEDGVTKLFLGEEIVEIIKPRYSRPALCEDIKFGKIKLEQRGKDGEKRVEYCELVEPA